MTGFATVRKAIAQGEIVFSLKSVNHRGLDLQFHLPSELDAMESEIRAALKSRLARGHVQVNVSIARTGGPGAPVLNRALLDIYMRAFREAAGVYRVEGQPDLNSALRVPGMLSAGEAEDMAVILLQNMKAMKSLDPERDAGVIAELRAMTRLYLASKLSD